MHTSFVNYPHHYISILTLFLIVDIFSSLWDKYPGKCGKSTFLLKVKLESCFCCVVP